MINNLEVAAAVRNNSWYGFLGKDLVSSLIRDFEPTPLVDFTRHVLFAREE